MGLSGILIIFAGSAIVVIYCHFRGWILRKKISHRINYILDTALEEKKKGGFE